MTPKILIADDDRDLVDALTMHCESLGIDVLTAHDGFTAIELAHQQRPDVLCLDVNMPGGGGLTVCEMLSGDESLAKLPVIILTGQTRPETVRRCWDMCAYYVLKSTDTWNRLAPLLKDLLFSTPERRPAPHVLDADRLAISSGDA